MTALTTEQKFQQLRTMLTQQEFDSTDFLKRKSESIASEDPELAKRIMMRVHNLNKHRQQVQANKDKSVVVTSQPNNAVVKPLSNSDSLKAENTQRLSLVENNQSKNKGKIPLSPFYLLVLIPSFLFALYQCFWATERFESQAQVIVQQPDGMATMDSSMMILSGLGVSNSGVSDTELVKAYILSNDMLTYLDDRLNLKQHYSSNSVDYFSRMKTDDTWEDFFNFYKKHVAVSIDSNSNIVHIYSQGFDPEFAYQLTQTIVNRAEWYINSIGHQLAEAQLEFIKREHTNIEAKLEQAQTKLLSFQQRYNLLDPLAEGVAMQQITYGLEGQITAQETELKGLLSSMSERAPQVVAAKAKLTALKTQLEKERNKLSTDSAQNIPVSEILAKYTDLKVKMDLALQGYTSSQVSLEKSRIEAYRQLKFLIVVEAATKPEESKYPNAFYNISLFSMIVAMLFAIGKIIIITIKELK